jgi:predicted DNA-binding transcriptional regulator AlpA
MPPLETLLDEAEVSKVIGRSVPTLQKDRVKGAGPPYVKLGRHVRYRPSDVQAWLAEHVRLDLRAREQALLRAGADRLAMTQTRKTRRAGGAAGSSKAVSLAGNSPQNSHIERAPQAQSRFRTIHFEAVNRAAIAALPAILARLMPGGKRIGGEYVVLNPIRADRRLGSFKINVRTGRWADFATGDKGGRAIRRMRVDRPPEPDEAAIEERKAWAAPRGGAWSGRRADIERERGITLKAQTVRLE